MSAGPAASRTGALDSRVSNQICVASADMITATVELGTQILVQGPNLTRCATRDTAGG